MRIFVANINNKPGFLHEILESSKWDEPRPVTNGFAADTVAVELYAGSAVGKHRLPFFVPFLPVAVEARITDVKGEQPSDTQELTMNIGREQVTVFEALRRFSKQLAVTNVFNPEQARRIRTALESYAAEPRGEIGAHLMYAPIGANSQGYPRRSARIIQRYRHTGPVI